MYLTKAVAAENGAVVEHHRVTRVEMSIDMLYLHCFVSSWPTAALRDAGQLPLAHWLVRAAVADLDFSSGMGGAIEDACLSSAWFVGASVVHD